MHLDVPTLMAMGSLIAACAGAVLLIAWWQNRKISVLALWGLANIATAGGVFSLMLGSGLGQPLVTALGGSLVVLAQGLIWKAARTFDARPAPLVLALLGMVVVGLVSGIPGIRHISGSLGLALSSAYLFAAATALWLGRMERLAARRPIIVFTAVHAAGLLISA